MKSQVYDRFGGGLLLLVMLTIAVIAGESQPTLDEPTAIEDVLESDAGLPIDVTLEETKTPEPEIVDSSDLSVQ